MTIRLQAATEADIPLIAALARKIWYQHYVSIIGTDQIEYMLNMMYSDASLKDQMNNKGHRFYLIREGELTLGFVGVSGKQGEELFIHKFYIDQDLAGKGIGSRVFKLLLELYSPQCARLTVNRQNYKSINFYFKNGFVIEKVADFDIGQGYVMNDFVMIWKKL
ncbi:MAG: GNAT family N-acetyltransferase [Bacteroidetes bacterium]|nr:GNAT family N-acetyltransferase [Bacteroidota bacterium]